MQFDPQQRETGPYGSRNDPAQPPRSMWDDRGFGDDAPPADPGQAPLPMPSPLVPPPSSALPAPAPATDAKASRRAGAAIVLTGVGVGTGALLGGLWGAGSGLFFAGALSNAYRANSLWRSDFADDRKEAIKATVMTVLGVGLAGYLGYRAREARDDD